jgi:phosphoserine phosphatase RsbU-like protein
MNAAESGHGGTRNAELERVRRDYTFAFLTYRLEGTEHRLQAAYELGRKAMAGGLSLLDLAKVHHEVVAEALLASRDAAALQDVTGAASAFFVEVLSTFEMTQRGFAEIRQTIVEDRGYLSPESAPPP